MALAITDDHKALADVAADLLTKRDARAESRAALEAPEDALPQLWKEYASLGWLGLHLPEEHGGAGYGLPETAVVVEQLGRFVAPGPFVPSVIASAVIAAAGTEETRRRLLPALVSGDAVGGVALSTELASGQRVTGEVAPVLGAGTATVLVLPAGDDVLVVEVGPGVTVTAGADLDPTRRAAKVRLEDAPATVLPGARQLLLDTARVLLAAEALGVAAACTEQSAAYAKTREQFGRVIGVFQAVKHHCANMAMWTESATATVWDAARAAAVGGDQLTYAAAAAAALAGPAAYRCANLNIQVHGGIGFTWEHDAHLYLRRGLVLNALLEPDSAAAALSDLTRRGVQRERSVDLPPEAEATRAEVRAFVERLTATDPGDQRTLLIDSGYLRPNWPAPFGRGAGAVEQLVIEQEFTAAGIKRSLDVITGYVMLTLIQQAAPEQVQRWVPPALAQEATWCQLFSEPDAGSDAANIKTRAVRADGGWVVNGQKVWTSGAQVAKKGFATVRTNPDAPKHKGVTTMVIDMAAPGVEVRPLRQVTGDSHFNEVFLTDVFVPDEDVVGEIDAGWTVARATLGNESVSIGSNESGMTTQGSTLLEAFDRHPERLAGGDVRIGYYIATLQAQGLLNLRVASRAVAGGGPGPESAITKLIISELGHEAAAVLAAVNGPELVFVEGEGLIPAMLNLTHRIFSIGGGTSEIKRNQIGERVLGLPRDPLIV
jgi:alkylation response protein AidB-like acyl-CoA dehydrogenase